MESRLKERLIGAIVLVLLGVWLIPWLLDGANDEAEPEAVALSLPTPQEAAPVKTQTIDLEQERNPTAGVPAESEPAHTAASEPRGGESAKAPAPALPSSAQVQSSPTPKPAAAAKAASGPGATATPSPAATPTKSAAKPPAVGDWTVQLGSFGDEANAGRLAERVSSYGYEAEVSPYRTGGRLMHRVRVGPQKTRAEAEAVASSLSAHGFVAQVVTAD